VIRDRIVCGLYSDNVRARLLRESQLTLQKALDMCRAAESSDQQMQNMTASTDMPLNVVKSKKASYKNVHSKDT